MTAECVRNALLQRTMDNKENTSVVSHSFKSIFLLTS
jgi:hypothetical protein